MVSERPLPVESLLPFSPVRPSELRSALQDAQSQDPTGHSQSPDSQEDDEADGSGNDKPKRQKRSRACVACRNMKIRCLPVEGQEACSACAKVNRQCIMPGPPRKRQKTVHKVAELEKKINALTDALLAKQQQAETGKSENESPVKDAATTSSSEPARTEDSSNTSIDSYARNIVERAFPETSQPEFITACEVGSFEPVDKDNYVDVVDRGDMTMETATSLYTFWRDQMCSSNPIVVFAANITAEMVRRTRPITFLTILTVASAVTLPSAQPALTIELNRQISERVLFHGDKSLDLVQAMLLNSQYYVRPRSARDLAFNQNIHAAIIMALELGIGKRSKLKRTPKEELELCRTWLACYQASITVTTILRLPTLIKFNSRLAECLDLLETSPLALPTDKWLVAIVRLSRIAEEISTAFSMDDPGAELNFSEPRIQYQLKCFENQLHQWEKDVDVSVDPRLVQHHAACINLYMHEIAIHYDHNVDDFRPGVMPQDSQHSLRKGPEFVTSSQVDALSTLLASSQKILDIYLSLEVACVRPLTNLYIVWNAYAVVVLIKLHWIFHTAEARLGGGSFLPDMKPLHYLDSILQKLAEITLNGRNPCAEAFGFVFMKLKIWHLHRTGQLGDNDQVGGTGAQEGGGEDAQDRRRRGSSILHQNPVEIISTAKRMQVPPLMSDGTPAEGGGSGSGSGMAPMRGFAQAFALGSSWNGQVEKFGTNLNAAFDAASYGNTNWDQFNFSTEELDMFDIYMNNSGWMGYLL